MNKSLRKKIVEEGNLPVHIAIIMDGNGRWAKANNLPRVAGHVEGINSVREIVQVCGEIGVSYLTLYTFSNENWKRPQKEVSAIMKLLLSTIKKEVRNLNNNNVRLSTIGNLNDLPDNSRQGILEGIEITKNNTGLNLVLALSYSSRQELLMAVERIAGKILSGEMHSDQISEKELNDAIAKLELKILQNKLPSNQPIMELKISADNDPIIGNPNAPITIIEFSDFQCPFCAKFHIQTLPTIMDEYINKGTVKLVFRDFPIQSIHPNAVPASIAAECANEQGEFEQMYHMLFEKQKEWSNLETSYAITAFNQYASELQLNEEKFNQQEESLKLLSWQPAHVIGIDEANRQHKKMLDMMNEVHILSAQNYSVESISQALDVLISYTEVHFSWEEKFFDSYQYPKSQEHKKHHASLIEELRNHQKNIAIGDQQAIDKGIAKVKRPETKEKKKILLFCPSCNIV